jgi:hypothetical protein
VTPTARAASTPAASTPAATKPAAAALDLPLTIGQCLFRNCDWTLINPSTTPADVVDDRVAAHLLTAHVSALRLLGRLADSADLL